MVSSDPEQHAERVREIERLGACPRSAERGSNR